MTKQIIRAFAVALLYLATAHLSYATQFINRNFETGDLSGWGVVSGGILWAQAVDSTFGVPALQGEYSALLVTRDLMLADWGYGPCPPYDAWSITCPIPIPFTSAQSTTAPQGTASFPLASEISQQIALRAGDVISFDFQRFTNEAFWTVDDVFVALLTSDYANGVCGEFGQVNSPDMDSCNTFPRNRNYILGDAPTFLHPATGSAVGFAMTDAVYRWQLTAPFDGVWTLTIGIGSNVDPGISSGLLVDNFHVLPAQALPEPPALALLALVLAGLGFGRRKRAS